MHQQVLGDGEPRGRPGRDGVGRDGGGRDGGGRDGGGRDGGGHHAGDGRSARVSPVPVHARRRHGSPTGAGERPSPIDSEAAVTYGTRTDEEPAAPMTFPFADADPKVRRRLLMRSGLRIVLTSAVLLVVYYSIPLADLSGGTALLAFVACVITFLGVVAWQVQAIVSAPYPNLRAAEAVGMAVPLLIVLFALVYQSMSDAQPGTFSQPLSRTGALYFTITVLATVGFGDIVPTTDGARLLVSAQMVLDLLLVGVVLRVLTHAASRARASAGGGRPAGRRPAGRRRRRRRTTPAGAGG